MGATTLENISAVSVMDEHTATAPAAPPPGVHSGGMETYVYTKSSAQVFTAAFIPNGQKVGTTQMFIS